MSTSNRTFASDNWAGVHPDVLAAIVEANVDHAPSYGDDPTTDRAVQLFKDHFGEDAEVFIAFNGTGANVVGLQSLLRPFEAVICAETAHINVDECGAPERFLGSKLIPVATYRTGSSRPNSWKRRRAGSGTSTTSSPRWCRSPSPPRSERATASKRWPPSPIGLTGAGCGSTWMGPGSPMPQPPSASTWGRSAPPAVSTCSPMGGRRTAPWGPRRLSRSGRRTGRRCDTSASSRCSWRPRCDSSPPSSLRCSPMTSGGRMRCMPTSWPHGSQRAFPAS